MLGMMYIMSYDLVEQIGGRQYKVWGGRRQYSGAGQLKAVRGKGGGRSRSEEGGTMYTWSGRGSASLLSLRDAAFTNVQCMQAQLVQVVQRLQDKGFDKVRGKEGGGREGGRGGPALERGGDKMGP